MANSTYLRTEDIPLAQLTPFPGNAKRGRVDKIRASLRAHGQFRSLVVRHTDDRLIVLAGNHTMLALAEEGSTHARCEVITCDDATATKINLVDNKTADDGEYDQLALADLLRGLEGDYEGTGFADDEVSDLLEALEEAEQRVTEELAYTAPQTFLNRNDIDVEARIGARGSDSASLASRGVRDIILALPAGQAEELGQLVMKIREHLGARSQGEIILCAARVTARVIDQHGVSEEGNALEYADPQDTDDDDGENDA